MPFLNDVQEFANLRNFNLKKKKGAKVTFAQGVITLVESEQHAKSLLQ